MTGSSSPRQTTSRVSVDESPRLTNRYRGIIGGRLQDKVNSSVQEDTISRWEKSRRGKKKFIMDESRKLLWFFIGPSDCRTETAISTNLK